MEFTPNKAEQPLPGKQLQETTEDMQKKKDIEKLIRHNPKPYLESNLDSKYEVLRHIRCLITVKVESSILSNRQEYSR